MANQVGPIRPSDVDGGVEFPGAVFQAFNDLIQEKIRCGTARILVKDVLAKMKRLGLKENDIFENGWLDVETLYRVAGWNVTYDQPIAHGGESFEPFFIFKKSGSGK